ncbi:hypothetical protein K8R66_00410 [bacterium]|nr:hypothetical protein [bacterium]
MKIDFTKKQFETLLKMVYMGDWVVNGVRTGAKDDKFIKKYKELVKYIYFFARGFKLENYADEELDGAWPSRELEESEVRGYINYYDEDIFWEELASRLAMRDFHRDYTMEEIKDMDFSERIENDHPYLERYWNEIDGFGLDRLEINEEK